jgi:hypothetical protein
MKNAHFSALAFDTEYVSFEQTKRILFVLFLEQLEVVKIFLTGLLRKIAAKKGRHFCSICLTEKCCLVRGFNLKLTINFQTIGLTCRAGIG